MTVPQLAWPRGEAPRQARLAIVCESIQDHALVRAALNQPGAQGWICTTDRVLAVDDAGEIPLGRVISAELALPDGQSIQLRQHGGGWLLTRLIESDEGEPVLSFDQRFESSREGGAWRMAYRSYWRQEPTGSAQVEPIMVWRPWVAAFRGWDSRRGGDA